MTARMAPKIVFAVGVSIALFALFGLTTFPSVFSAEQGVSAPHNLVTTIVNESFEDAFPPPGWSATGHWGKSNCQFRSGSYSAWAEGSGGLTCPSVYHQSENSSLQYGPFDLSDALTATLEFDLHLWSAQGDTFSWRASADGVTFFGQSIGETFPAVWNRQTLDLSAVPGLGDLRGDSTVWVSFTWQTDDFAEAFNGPYIDNVRIVKGIAPAAEQFLPILTKPCPAAGALFYSTLAMNGDSSDSASAPDAPSLDVGIANDDDFTVETFFYVPDLSNSTTDTLFQKSGSYLVYILFKNDAPDRIIYRIWITAFDYVFLDYDIDLSVGWHHLAVVFDNEFTADQDRMALYLDGSLVKNATNVEWTPGIRDTSSPTTIGGSYTGWFDEVRISDNIRYDSLAYVVPGVPFTADVNTRSLWHFDEAEGSTIFVDGSLHSNTLAAVNNAHAEACGN